MRNHENTSIHRSPFTSVVVTMFKEINIEWENHEIISLHRSPNIPVVGAMLRETNTEW